ncbi:MAG TPA: ATP-binding protein [Candidatus Binatia bacterium]|nr:ATP-binding protein [Candidatus Binatia bacterium]
MGLAIFIFVVDVFTPADVLSFFYVVPIFLALLSGNASFFWVLSVLVAVASTIAYETSLEIVVPSVHVNGALFAAEVLLVATLLHVLRRQRERTDRTNRLLEAIMRQMPAGVVVADPDGAIVLTNDRAGDLWPDAGKRASSPVQRALAHGEETRAVEVPVLRADGAGAVLSVSAAPVRDAAGGTLAAVMICNDVTETKRAAEERQLLLARERIARADAEAANRTKDQFLAAVSHDLRSPLSAIAVWTRVLRLSAGTADVIQPLERIDGSVRLLGRLIDDLLDVSRITTGTLRFDMMPTDLADTVAAALDSARATAESKHVDVRAELAGGSAPVVGDASRLQQVAANLVGNAVKFTPAGGTVVVRVDHTEHCARLTVHDTGSGIPPDFLPHVFERFAQAPDAPRQGLGLGLAIVRHIVEAHGGSVRAESEGPGQGATFTVELPLAPSANGAIAFAAP